MASVPNSTLAAALDPAQEHVANLRRRAAMLARHARALGPDGKSTLAVQAGRLGGRRTAEKQACPSEWGLRMALKRWHNVPIPQAWVFL